MELVCSPRLNLSDIEVCRDVLSHPHRWLSKALPSSDEVQRTPDQLLGWVLCRGLLHIKIAVLRNATTRAIYHEKLGVIESRTGALLGFTGSANETASAYVNNFESIQVFRESDEKDRTTIRHLQDDFDRLWTNRTPGLEVIALHEALARDILEPLRPEDDDSKERPTSKTEASLPGPLGEILTTPSRLSLRPHQADAIERWFEAGGVGIYAMATGAGKTIAALATATRVFQRAGGPLIVVVVAPFLALVDQWLETMRWFGLRPLRCADSSAQWLPGARNAVLLANRDRRPVVSFVVTNRTFMGEPFQDLMRRFEVRTLLIADEVHNLGATGLRRALPEHVALRLGLSATPERKWDDAGTLALQEYFGEPVIRFGLAEALKADPPVLCPYAYYPIVVELEEDELEEYLRLTRSIGRLLGAEGDPEKNEVAFRLLIRRSRLISTARKKLAALRRLMAGMNDTHFNLVYCGDGRTEYLDAEGRSVRGTTEVESPDDALPRQVDAVVRLLGRELKMRVAPYTSETPPEERASTLKSFREGRLQALVAIRCLDEGVDIPDIRRAFILASSTNPRQFIQRRGRVLRRPEGKQQAEIYDFFVAPPMDRPVEPEVMATERNLVRREMERAVDFIELAINSVDARHRLLPLLTKMQLLDMLAPRTTTAEGV